MMPAWRSKMAQQIKTPVATKDSGRVKIGGGYLRF